MKTRASSLPNRAAWLISARRDFVRAATAGALILVSEIFVIEHDTGLDKKGIKKGIIVDLLSSIRMQQAKTYIEGKSFPR